MLNGNLAGRFLPPSLTLYQQNQAGSELSLWGHRPPNPDFLLIHVKRKQKRAPRRGGYTGL